jgi:hypothetical protein
MKLQTLTQAFNDGIVSIYSVGNIAEPGNMPQEGLTLKVGPLHYEERTVGMSRFWTALQANAKVEQMLRVPRINCVSPQDIAIPNDAMQYKIIQIQYPKGIEPPCMDLSLERVDSNYDIK